MEKHNVKWSNVCDVRQRLIDRINQLKKDKRDLFGSEDYFYSGGRQIQGGTINEKTADFYKNVYDRLVKELEDILGQ